MVLMTDFKARVKNGRLVLDEATDLPEGAEIDLVPADWWDALDERDRVALEEELARSNIDAKAGRTVSAADLLRSLRERR